MELVIVLVIIFIVFLFVGAVYGFIAHSKAQQIARDLELAHSKLGRVLTRLEKLESSFSLSSQADKVGAAIHAQQKGEKVDSKKNAQNRETLESTFEKTQMDCHAAAHAATRNDSTNTAHNGTKVDSKRSCDSSPQAQSLAKDSSKPQSTAHPSTQPTPKFQRLLQTFTQNSLALLGGIFFILAAFFLVNYSINHSLITPQVRIGLSLAFGVLLLACGLLSTLYQHTLARKLQRLSHKSPSIIAQTCIGAGLVVEFLAVYGGYYFYGFFGLTGAFALLAFIAVFALVLTLRYGVVIGIFGVLGSFSTPVLLASGAYHATMLFVYVLVCYFFALSIAIRSRQFAIFLIANVFVLGYMLDFVFLREVGRGALVLLVFVVVALLGAHSVFALMYAPTLSTNEQARSGESSKAMSLWRNALGLSLAFSALVLCVGIAGIFARFGYMDFGTLELAFLAFVMACLFALPALTRFARYPISPLYLSLPIPFGIVMLCFVIKAAGASTLVALGFMAGIVAGLYVYVRFRDLACGLESADCHAENNARNDAKGTSSAKVDSKRFWDSKIVRLESWFFKACKEIRLGCLSTKQGAEIRDSSPQAESLAKDSSVARMRVWYLWLMSFSALCFLLLSTQIACLDWIESAGKYAMWILGLGVFGWVYRAVVVYGLTPYRDVLLLVSALGALGLIGDDLLHTLPRTMRASLLWLASGILLALLGRTRILPRGISGFEWVFAGFGLLATWAHIVEIDLLYGLFGSLRGSYLPELGVFMLVSAINLWLLARAVDSPAASLSTWRSGIFAALAGLLLWEILALINLCALWIVRHWFMGFDNFFMRESLSRTLVVCAVFAIAFGALTISGRVRTKQNLAQQSQLANHSSHQKPLHQNPLWIKFYTRSSLVLFVYGLVGFCSLLLSYKGYTYAYAAVEMDMLQALNQLFIAIIAQVVLVGLAGVLCLCYTKSLATSWHAQGAKDSKKDTKDSATFARFSLQLIANTAALVGIVGALVYAIRLCFAGKGDISFGDIVIGDRSLLYEFGSAGFGEIELYTYSIALVLLGIIMLAGYFISRYKVYKIYAFVLFGAATLKVFFIDTSRLDSLAKIALFVCMGVLFLSVSYVYSKYVSSKERG